MWLKNTFIFQDQILVPTENPGKISLFFKPKKYLNIKNRKIQKKWVKCFVG